MTKVYVATFLNWMLPGFGWIILGRRPILGGVLMLGMIGLTVVEFGVQTAAPQLYFPMFGCVLLVNTILAIDCYLEGAKAVAQTAPNPA